MCSSTGHAAAAATATTCRSQRVWLLLLLLLLQQQRSDTVKVHLELTAENMTQRQLQVDSSCCCSGAWRHSMTRCQPCASDSAATWLCGDSGAQRGVKSWRQI